MKTKLFSKSGLFKRSTWAGILLVVIALITLEATSLIQYYFSKEGIKREATQRAESHLNATRNHILDIVDQAEAAVRNSVWIASWCLYVPDSLQRIPERIVADNPVVVGSTMAMVPGYFPDQPLCSPYVFRGEDGKLSVTTLATQEYDYPSKEWFAAPLESGEGYWSEPYVDEGGGNILMTTYSLPIRDMSGKIAAIITADISLDWLTKLLGGSSIYPNAYNMVISRAGRIMVCPRESLVMTSTVHEAIRDMDDTSTLKQLNAAMLSGESGHMEIIEKNKKNQVFYAPVEKTGWSLNIVIPDHELYGGIKRIGMLVTLLQILGLALIIVILVFTARNQIKFQNLNNQKEKMEGELHVAKSIQMSMIPKTFPPFPERKDIDMSAAIVPAKEVGGDLYDFFIKEEKLYFCIGDVSGKGVPASLVMAVTRSLFRTLSAHEQSPSRIVTMMNDSMAEMNENNMFVTFFCGILDLATGHMRYCNAGHNAPMMLTTFIGPLDVKPNIPLGVIPGMSFTEQEKDFNYDDAIFLYTDGVTEAENIDHVLFGEERMKEVLHGRKSAAGHMDAMKNAITAFVGEAPQSDDITMLFIHYTNNNPLVKKERHLILHNDIQQIPQLADFIETIAREAELDQSSAMSLNLALEEAVTNVILYAYPEGSDGIVDIEAVIREHELEFIISDGGSPFDPTAAPEADTALGVDERPIGGLGIFLVRNIMDTVTYERKNGKNVLSMFKNI